MGLVVWFNQHLHKRTRYQLVDFAIDDVKALRNNCLTSVAWQQQSYCHRFVPVRKSAMVWKPFYCGSYCVFVILFSGKRVRE